MVGGLWVFDKLVRTMAFMDGLTPHSDPQPLPLEPLPNELSLCTEILHSS